MTDRAALAQQFLDRAGWGTADRRFLAGDASDRSYDRLTRHNETAVLMDAPPDKTENPGVFLQIADHLLALGLSAPRCMAQDLTQGFLLLEDLGDDIYAQIAARNPLVEQPLYTAAADVLVHLQDQPPPANLPNLTAGDWADAAVLALNWYSFAITGKQADPAAFRNVLADLISTHADGARVMILRDFHAENLLWLPHRAGRAKVGLLDFQLAQMGQPGYDLVSLLQDARRDVSRETQTATICHFLTATGAEAAKFETAYAVLGAQRCLRILGVFARLCLVAEKPGYIALIPRVWGHLQANLATAPLSPLADLCATLLPPPTPETLAKIGSQCGHFR